MKFATSITANIAMVAWGSELLPVVSFVLPVSSTHATSATSLSVAMPMQMPSSSTTTSSITTKDSSYLRWNKEGDTWKMQTAVTSFQRGTTVVDLHAQLHFGDAAYFDYYNNDPVFLEELDHVHYELLVDDSLLDYDLDQGRWRVTKETMASPNDQVLAQSYDWTCQASQIDYTQPKWIHADMSRQEFLTLAETQSKRIGAGSSSEGQQQQPLWKAAAASSQSSSAAAEAVSALFVGPPQLSYETRALKRRLFTNLFLPGNQLANALRALLWMTVPAPEFSVMLLDWSSLLQTGRRSSSKGGSSGRRIQGRDFGTTPSALSEVAWPILSSLVQLDIASTRRFLFGQVLVTSNANAGGGARNQESSAWSLLVTQRNDHALNILERSLEKDTEDRTKKHIHTALLYGSSHCPDLQAKLVAAGFTPARTTWRTAWSVQEPPQGSPILVPALLSIALVGYLVIGALDWVGMMGDVSQAALDYRPWDAMLEGLLYLARHVLLYLGLSKFLVDWTNTNTNTNND